MYLEIFGAKNHFLKNMLVLKRFFFKFRGKNSFFKISCGIFSDDDKHGRRDRFHSGITSDFKDKEHYKPNVKLEYIDDSGRLLNEKEAFRYLSHKFHGKGPGKNKIEKRLKKSEQETVSNQALCAHFSLISSILR